VDTVLTPETFLARLREMSVFVAVETETSVILGTISSKIVSKQEGHLRDMAVLPHWQGGLVASELLARAEQELRDQGCISITLNTTQPLQRAMRFYEKRGFQKTGRITDFYGMALFEYRKTIPARTDALVREITRLQSQKQNRAHTAKAIAEVIRAWGCYRWVGIYEVNLADEIVCNLGWSGPSGPSHPSFPITKGLTSRAIATKKTVNVGDVASDPDYLTALATTRSEIIIPVLDVCGDRVLGTVDVESERPDAFDPPTQESLENCADLLRQFLDAEK
jgi:L-methionine (R)-S-oxide reductase